MLTARNPVIATAPQRFELWAKDYSALEDLARTYECSIFTALATSFIVLLHRYTLEEHIAVSVSGSGCEADGLQIEFADDPSFHEVVRRAATQRLRFYPGAVPNDQTLEVRQVVSSSGPESDVRGLGLICDADGASLVWYSDNGEPEPVVTARVGRIFLRLLAVAIAEPQLAVSRLPLLSDEERARAIELGRGEHRTYERDATVHGLFKRQVRRSPTAVAAIDDGGSVTYAELESRANRLANRLLSVGLRRGATVGIAVERSIEVLVALLAVLKAGGAYVPLDKSYPPERLAFILEDAAVAFIITDSARRATIDSGWAVLEIDVEAGASSMYSDAEPEANAEARDVAYIMYTSGSTGRPKGVAIEHRGIVRLVRGSNYFDVAPNDVFLHFAPLAFDASTFEIWGALLNGGTVAMPRDGLLAISELNESIERFGVTTMFLTTSIFNRFVDGGLANVGSLRRLLTGGEVASPAHMLRFLEGAPACRLVAAYGPTENTTFSTCFGVDTGASIGPSVPIGTPIANSSAYVLDRHMEPVPIGLPGELCVGGDGVARGYLNLPDLTAERFVPDPYADVAGATMYRTGDRARLRIDGAIEFLGRNDNQVKIRGFRIELGEIEAALQERPDVRAAAVVVGIINADKLLCAYVVPSDDTRLDDRELREHLKAKLPLYMIPHHISVVDGLPAQASGKVDRVALARLSTESAPARNIGFRTGGTQLPGNRDAVLRARIAAIWREALGTQRDAELDQNFFDAGGDSLQLLSVQLRLQQEFGFGISVMEMFEHCTIRKLAGFLENRAHR